MTSGERDGVKKYINSLDSERGENGAAGNGRRIRVKATVMKMRRSLWLGFLSTTVFSFFFVVDYFMPGLDTTPRGMGVIS